MIRIRSIHRLFAVGATSALATWALPYVGQSTLSLRFDPTTATRVNTISSSDLTLQIVEFADNGSDTSVVRGTRLESATRFVDAVDGYRYSVYLQYDSVRTRIRSGESPWRELQATDRDLASVRAVLDDKLRVMNAEFVDLPHLDAPRSELARGLAGVLLLALPDGEISVGGTFEVEPNVSARVFMGLGNDYGVGPGEDLMFRGSASLDSQMVRMRDTLTYLTIGTQMQRRRFGTPSDQESSYAEGWGSLAASLVWSSSWDAYVLGAVRVVADMEVRRRSDRSLLSRVRFDVTTRFQVRL
jgi:hypothetical protein